MWWPPHAALVDPLPAGLEILNPELAVTGNLPEEPDRRRGRWWWGSRYRKAEKTDVRTR